MSEPTNAGLTAALFGSVAEETAFGPRGQELTAPRERPFRVDNVPQGNRFHRILALQGRWKQGPFRIDFNVRGGHCSVTAREIRSLKPHNTALPTNRLSEGREPYVIP